MTTIALRISRPAASKRTSSLGIGAPAASDSVAGKWEPGRKRPRGGRCAG